jgi:hypothetical protein
VTNVYGTAVLTACATISFASFHADYFGGVDLSASVTTYSIPFFVLTEQKTRDKLDTNQFNLFLSPFRPSTLAIWCPP